MRQIFDRLMRDPIGWGNPLNNFKVLNMILYHGAEGMLYVQYAVNAEKRFVTVQAFKFVSESPFNLEE